LMILSKKQGRLFAQAEEKQEGSNPKSLTHYITNDYEIILTKRHSLLNSILLTLTNIFAITT